MIKVGFVVALLFICAVSGFSNVAMKHSFLDESHHLHKHFSQRKVNTDEPTNFQMGGNIYPVGIYWVDFELGTPVQPMLAAVDTGSSDLLVPSATCDGCHEQNTGSFNTTSSSTLTEITCQNKTVSCSNGNIFCEGQCSFSNSYQTCNLTDLQQICTVTGNLYSDVYTQGELTASVVFGLIEMQTKNFQQFFVIDGVLGMAFAAGSSWGGQPPFQRLVQEGEVANIYAMCMQPNAGGVLTLGGTDPALYTGDFAYTPLKKFLGDYVLFVLQVTDLQVAGQTIGLPVPSYTTHGTLGGCVLDSGTNTILFPTPIYAPWLDQFNNFFKASCASSSAPKGVCDGSLAQGQCFQYTQAEREAFPEVEFILDDVTLSMKGPDYIVSNSTATGDSAFYCLGVFDTGAHGNFIIGDVLMQNYYVSFDLDQKRVGWATANLANCIGSTAPILYDSFSSSL